VHFWWGDERFLPGGHRDRNDTQARAALLEHLDLDPRTVHPMPASDGQDGPDLDAAAARYAAELAQFASPASPAAPQFDVLLLGLGPDGHVASLFPGHPQVFVDDVTVLSEPDSPKPPPQRLSLTLPTINDSHEIWLVVAGAEKADAVARAVAGHDPSETPAAAVKARGITRFLLDHEAAAALP
jgi:6-phosphogluconolactonase